MDGIINVLKPPGLTSRQVVSIVKGITKFKKVGHAGTLDPGACGVLPVMVGKATRLFDYMGEGKKEYIAEFSLGAKTSTQDSYGELIETNDKLIIKTAFETALTSLVGGCEQTPSIYSAIHINGKRAYDYAFEGKEVEMPTRTVTVYEAELLKQTGDNTFLVRILCSKGCYIRSLCEDLAASLGTVAYVSLLLRTKTGKFILEDSFTLDELENFDAKYIVPVETILEDVPRLTVNKDLEFALSNGSKLPLDGFNNSVEDGVMYRVFDQDNRLWALGQKDEDVVRIKIMLRVRQ